MKAGSEKWNVAATPLEGVVIIEPKVFCDLRGTFSETFSEKWFTDNIAPVRFVQDNESHSRRGVVRGLHFQKEPHSQAKLVRVAAGRIFDVAVDMRQGSATFGKWTAVELSAENRRQLFIPRGFAHGFAALEDDTAVIYKVDGYYTPESDAGVLWCDPALGIDWDIAPDEVIVSEKDAALPVLADAYRF